LITLGDYTEHEVINIYQDENGGSGGGIGIDDAQKPHEADTVEIYPNAKHVSVVRILPDIGARKPT